MKDEWKKKFHCDLCGSLCAEITVYRSLNDEGKDIFTLKLEGFSQSVHASLDPHTFHELMRLFPRNELGAIFKIDREFVPFYCTECHKCYCMDHWRRYMTFDEGYYDAEYGYCPKGHKRMLYD